MMELAERCDALKAAILTGDFAKARRLVAALHQLIYAMPICGPRNLETPNTERGSG
jgi:hypothetical protein